MELITLSQRICGQADRKLAREIEETLEPLARYLNDIHRGDSWSMTVEGRDENNAIRPMRCTTYQVMSALSRGIFAERAPEARQKAIDEFLKNLQKPNPPTPQ